MAGWAGAAVVLIRADALMPRELDPLLPAGARALAGFLRLFRSRAGRTGRPGERLAGALERLGPAGIKLGQFLSTRADVLGAEKVEGLRLRDTVAGGQQEEPMEGLFVAIGYKPNTDIFRESLDIDDKGYLLVSDETHTKIDGVFIAGDVHDHRYRQAVTAAADGCKAAIDAERWLEAQGIAEASTATAW